MSRTFVYRDGARLTLWMLYVITVLDAELWRLFGVHVIVTSAIRLHQEQIDIFRKRYVLAGGVNGRRVYDTRVWQGQRWYRIDPIGTVAPPGLSNHEIQGTTAAFDLRDTGRDAGITVKNSARGRWFRKVFMPKWGMDPEGDGFGEGWHSRIRNIDRTPPASPTSGGNATPIPNPTDPAPAPEEEEDDMPKNTGLLYLAPMDAPRKEQREYLLILNTGSGYQGEISSGLGGEIEADRRREFANAFDTTSIIRVNEAEAKAFKAGLPSIRPSA